MVGNGESRNTKVRKGAGSKRRGRLPAEPTSGSAPGEPITRDWVASQRIRIFWKLEDAADRLVVETSNIQTKILNEMDALLERHDLIVRLERLESSNRELEARLAGATNGDAIIRADAAPDFVLPASGSAH